MGLGRRTEALGRQLAHNRAGLAMIEFAFAMPFLLTIGLAGTEVANLAIVTLRLNQMAMLAADNAARVRNSIDEVDVNEVMIGMRFTGERIKFGSRGRVIISSIESNGQSSPNTGYKIGWQRCFGAKNVSSAYGVEGAGSTNAILRYGVTTAGVAASSSAGTTPTAGGALIVAEVRYTYHPLVASLFMGNRELHAVQTFPVRDRAQQMLTNSKALPDDQKRLCDNLHLSPT
jgi:Flp pilus assembly protein TadG